MFKKVFNDLTLWYIYFSKNSHVPNANVDSMIVERFELSSGNDLVNEKTELLPRHQGAVLTYKYKLIVIIETTWLMTDLMSIPRNY